MGTLIPSEQDCCMAKRASVPAAAFGQPVTLTATVSPTDGLGTVAFSNDGSLVAGCTAQSLSPVSGATYQAICTTSSLPVGSDGISATYSGDTDYAGSSGLLPQPQVVNQIPTTTTLVSSVNPSIHHQPVTFTATVAPTDGGGGVTFYAGTKVICTNVGLIGGKASCVDSTLKVGTHASRRSTPVTSTTSGAPRRFSSRRSRPSELPPSSPRRGEHRSPHRSGLRSPKSSPPR
jgi:hypothetical protein